MTRRRRPEPAWKEDFRQVHPTPEEQADWRAKQGTRFPLPKRVECRSCAKRMWLSGLGIGSHRRACSGRPCASCDRRVHWASHLNEFRHDWAPEVGFAADHPAIPREDTV